MAMGCTNHVEYCLPEEKTVDDATGVGANATRSLCLVKECRDLDELHSCSSA